MLIFIGVLGILFVLKFFFEKNEQSTKVAKEGGMMNKYNILIANLLSGRKDTKIYKITSDSVQLGVISMGSATMYFITQTFGNVTVEWKIDNIIFGQHKLEWTFPEYLDQGKMISRIINDVSKYQNNIARSHNLPEFE